MKLLSFIKTNISQIIFAAILTFGFVVLIFIQTFSPSGHFIVGCMVLYLLLLLELFSVQYWAKIKLQQLNMPLIDQYDRFTNLVLHIFLPTLAFWTICLFIYFEPNPGIWSIFIFFIYGLFLMLFVNLRAYYEDKYKLEEQTHYVYDLLKLLIYGLLIFNIFSLYYSYMLSVVIIGILIFSATLFIFSLNLLRYNHLNKSQYIYIISNSLINSVISILALISGKFNIFEITMFSFLIFYMSAGILHHRLRRDLTRELVVEYGVIALLAIAMFSAI